MVSTITPNQIDWRIDFSRGRQILNQRYNSVNIEVFMTHDPVSGKPLLIFYGVCRENLWYVAIKQPETKSYITIHAYSIQHAQYKLFIEMR